MRHFERCETRYMATSNHQEKEKPHKPYEKPVAKKIMPEEAKRKLIEHVSQGSQDAKEFLEMILADEAKKLSTGTKKVVTASE